MDRLVDTIPGWSLFVTSVISLYFLKRVSEVVISELYIYPIKSCKGIPVSESKVVKTGFEYDRIFVVIDKSGAFISQRKKPQMAMIETSIDWKSETLTVFAPGMPILKIHLKKQTNEVPIKAKVWQDTCDAFLVNTSGWFSQFFEEDGIELARFDELFVRNTDPKYAPTGQTAFSDGYPFLILSESSLKEIGNRAKKDITMARFRPNIVVKNCQPFAEDSWTNIVFRSKPNMNAKIVKPCSRCSIPDVDPTTGSYDNNRTLSKSLSSFRTGNHLNLGIEKWQKEVRSEIVSIF
jgi:uncharacterized protein YcbX